MKKELLLAASLTLASCNGAIAVNENTIWYGNDSIRNDPDIVSHEKCHQEQMRDMGGSDVFWKRYIEDPMFRCEAELSCGAEENHFACSDVKLIVEGE